MMKIFTLLVSLTLSSALYAHNVVSGAYADGMTIEGEIGFSNGVMADEGVVVEVFNESGVKLGETALTEGGVFVYQASAVQTHIFKANLSSGHIAEMTIQADELSDDAGVLPASAQAGVSQISKTSSPNVMMDARVAQINTANLDIAAVEADGNQGAVAITPAITTTELQSLIRSAVAQQVRPLQKELRAYKEKVMFRDIAGGLGFIFGLFGVAAWMASKRTIKET